MDKLFDKTEGTTTSFDNTSITDITKDFKVDEFVDWFVSITSFSALSQTVSKTGSNELTADSDVSNDLQIGDVIKVDGSDLFTISNINVAVISVSETVVTNYSAVSLDKKIVTESKIISNTENTIVFENNLVSNTDYTIVFVGREFLTELESDLSNKVKISDALISKKYNQANNDIHNKVFAYLRNLYKSSYYFDNLNSSLTNSSNFDPLKNILNITAMQQSFAYLILARIFQDLTIDQNSFESFKGYNMYQKNYNDGVKDSLAALQIDFNEDGEADNDEINKSASGIFFNR